MATQIESNGWLKRKKSQLIKQRVSKIRTMSILIPIFIGVSFLPFTAICIQSDRIEFGLYKTVI